MSRHALLTAASFLFPLAAAFLILGAFSLIKGKKALAGSISVGVAVFAAALFMPLEEALRFHFFSSVMTVVLGAIGFLIAFIFVKNSKLGPWNQKNITIKKNIEKAEQDRLMLKKESDELEKETVRTVRTYGVVKGLGEALSWEEMAPHMDFAVQNCMGFRDYALYLAEDGSELIKKLSRGSKLAEAPAGSVSPKPAWHAVSNENYLEIPIRKGEQVIAMLWLRSAPGAAVDKAQVMNEAAEVADELVMGLEKARLFSSLERLSRYDGLTGVYRRQVFNDRIHEEIRRSKSFRTNFSVLICDLDHFKNINDTYGHQAGDEVLKRVGKILKESIYETDFVARYGGEEFVILFPQADPQGVLRKAEAIRQRIEMEKFVFGWNQITVTTSIGISHYPANGTDPETLLSISDKALYVAKESGRNRVVDSSQIW